MKIDQKQVGDRKQVGTVDGKALHLIVTKGGGLAFGGVF